MDLEELIASAGFECVGKCDASALRVRPEVRGMCAADVYSRRFIRLHDALAHFSSSPFGVSDLSGSCTMLAAGPCSVCPSCSYPNEPCRFPEKKLVSMEAAGLVVNDACLSAGIPYYHGPRTIAYVGCVLM